MVGIIVCSRTVLFCVFPSVFLQSGWGGEEVGDAEEICGCVIEERGKGNSDTVREKLHSS